jgi:hypothetical protein
MIDDDDCGAVSGMRIGRGKKVLRENLPQCHFSIKNPTRVDLGSNPSHRCEKPMTNRLSYGTA